MARASTVRRPIRLRTSASGASTNETGLHSPLVIVSAVASRIFARPQSRQNGPWIRWKRT
ncbi:hypothetical protein ACFQZ4_13715 [Catellatospora coxensis]